MKIPITQSAEWAELQAQLGEKFHERTGKDYRFLAIEKHTPIGKYLYCPYGPVAESATAMSRATKTLVNLGRESDAVFIRIEPTQPKITTELKDSLASSRIRIVKTHDLNPKETWLLDLKGTEEDLKKKLPSRLLRYYKNREKQGITIETSHNPDDIKYLLNLQKSLARKKGISTFSEEYLKTELKQSFATLYLVRAVEAPEENASKHCADSIIAAGLVFDDNTTRYNLQGAQSEAGRKLHATGILTIQLILDAKAKNLETFDFWGIAPEGAPTTHPWSGFTAFKKTFAGYEQDYAGTHDLILQPARYKLYQALRKIRRFF